jgi:aminoglycoside 2'-N-acetyltransferase I
VAAAKAAGLVRVTRAHTAELTSAGLAAARALLDAAFADLPPDERFGDSDWEHALGGQHLLVHDGKALVGHGSLVQRRLLHDGRALRAGYVEAVATAPDHRRRGVGTAIMAGLEELATGYDLLALGATDDGVLLYESRGWHRWRGRLSALTPSGVVPTPDDEGWLFVLPGAAPLDLDAELTCDWRDGDLW